MEFKTSVRHMVEFIYRHGDIISSGNGTLSKEAMNAGSRIHRKLQKAAGSYYDAEVPLKITMKKGRFDLDITIEGRADGIIDLRGAKEKKKAREALHLPQTAQIDGPALWQERMTEERDVIDGGEEKRHDRIPADEELPADEDSPADVTIDEIKGVYRKLDDMEEPDPVHMAQAMCYAYIYAKENQLSEMNVWITYVNLDTEAAKRFTAVFSYDYLDTWFQATVDQLMKWVDMAVNHARKRDASIETLEFPYDYRPGQKQMAACVYKAIEGEKRLFVQAPTGIGKTMAAVFPAVKAFSTGLVTKIFYLTAKTVAGTVPSQAFDLLRERGACFSSVWLTAKEKICPNDEMECDAALCPYAKGHFDRINEALYEMISKEIRIDRDVIASYAEKYQVCPFELGLDATLFADGIIGDYNYVFDPRVNLKRFFSQIPTDTGRYVFLVDEAHNLVDRASAMYSASLIKEDFLELKKIVKPYSKKMTRSLDACNREFLELKRTCVDGECQTLADIGVLHLKLLHLHSVMETFLEEYKQIPERKDVLEFYFSLTNFLNVAELMDDSYVIYDELLPDGRFMVKLFCVHPANNLKLCLDKGVSTIFFSATILPVTYYMDLLSHTESDRAIYIPSPFDPDKRRILVGLDVSTKYTKRGASEYAKIAAYIRMVYEMHPGNYMIFFPSYQMMYNVQEAYEAGAGGDEPEILIQDAHMSEADREAFLNRFQPETRLIAFCIMGGIFSEGIDLTGKRLVGTVIVGPGLPQVCHERRLRMEYFNDRKQSGQGSVSADGFQYAYLYPGMNKVFQAAGRVIRTEEDRGVILLLDERFGRREYQELFPVEWSDAAFGTAAQIRNTLAEFWETVQEDW